MAIVSEIWKAVQDNQHYEVSNTGRVKSKQRLAMRRNGSPMRVKEREIVGGKTLDGYRAVSLYDNGNELRRTIHSLVARAFIGERPKDYTINHKDGNKENNHVENLEYVTQLENIHHALRTGLSRSGGENHQNSKFTETQVRTGYGLVKQGLTYKSAAKTCGMTETALRGACSGKNWKSLNLKPIKKLCGG